MICDSCEGAVRALPEPTPGRIEALIHQITMERLTDGQFDDCDITLRELNLVEQSLVKSLCAIHHGRIKYPSKTSAGEATRPASESLPQDEASPAPATATSASAETNNGNGNTTSPPKATDADATETPAPTTEAARQS